MWNLHSNLTEIFWMKISFFILISITSRRDQRGWSKEMHALENVVIELSCISCIWDLYCTRTPSIYCTGFYLTLVTTWYWRACMGQQDFDAVIAIKIFGFCIRHIGNMDCQIMMLLCFLSACNQKEYKEKISNIS